MRLAARVKVDKQWFGGADVKAAAQVRFADGTRKVMKDSLDADALRGWVKTAHFSTEHKGRTYKFEADVYLGFDNLGRRQAQIRNLHRVK